LAQLSIPKPSDKRVALLACEQIAELPKRTVPAVRSVRRNVTRLLKSADATSVFNVATVLLSDGDVPKWFVYELVHYHADTMAKLNLKKLSQLAQGIAEMLATTKARTTAAGRIVVANWHWTGEKKVAISSMIIRTFLNCVARMFHADA
jgi:hypothetical protein